jgi:hypothetical protein
MQDAAVDMIEMNEKNEKEETDLKFFRNNKARGVSDAVFLSPRQERQEKRCTIVSEGKHVAPINHMSPRTSMVGSRAASSVILGTGHTRRRAFQRHSSSRGWRESDSRHDDGSLEEIPEERNDKIYGISDAAVLPQQRQETKCNISLEGKHAATNIHMSPRRSHKRKIASRRRSWAASSSTLGPGSMRRHALSRTSSLRGWCESDLQHADSLEEISEVTWTRLHDYDARSYSDATLSREERHVRRCIISPFKQAAPNSHVSPKRSIAGRRRSWAASSTTFGPGSKGRHTFPRQSSFRGSDSDDDGALAEISKAQRTRLHDYTESPINVL